MKALLEILYARLEEGQDAVVTTIIAGSGSTPRGAGAKMVVTKLGRLHGTIGGGPVEYVAEGLAQKALDAKQSYVKGFRLSLNQVEDLGMVCGGDVDVHFQYISGNNETAKSLLEQSIAMLDRDEDSWLITDITDETSWSMGAYSGSTGLVGLDLPLQGLREALGNNPRQVDIGGRRLYIEPLVRSGRVIVFGGGHISQELVPIITHLGFRVVVFDDREEYAAQGRFPGAQVIVGDFSRIGEKVILHPKDYVVVMTRGHSHDYEVQRQVLKSVQVRYLGVIGSRTKIARTKQMLLEDGISESQIDRIYTPIGMEIKAETPAEIAISIAGELIAVRAQGQR